MLAKQETKNGHQRAGKQACKQATKQGCKQTAKEAIKFQELSQLKKQ